MIHESEFIRTKKTMRSKSLFAVCLLAASAIAFNAQAAPTWTVTATGTIFEGFDTSGVFGVAGRNLIGSKYTQTFTASIDPSQYVDKSAGSTYVALNGPIPTPVRVTVDGVTVNLVPTGAFYSQEYLAKRLAVADVTLDEIYSYANSSSGNGDFFEAYNNLVSYSKYFVPTLDFSQSLSIVPDTSFESRAHFYIRGGNSARFNGTIDLFEVNLDANVPEPCSLALIGLGILGVVATRRRRFKAVEL
jgi:hypothetical protein